ncbi:MAG: bifunctional DNA-formamidopyrimidine glycosylase/DNA-(apurinic or apyrimidinic site) lyase [bacterium]|nr:bifunctional DNA-formamidopyrimidine glycosylase/DNA-(apurinic or apyrimidinic site) lyase [bacterium]MCP4964882.1 bifunctional DNA-formamidopyrimidine glycosylase/DNA-(apurinic or apyrimidinic site) lyase [bacterium]
MPELPEVETTRRSLEPVLTSRLITGVTVARPRMVRRQANPEDFSRRMLGQRIMSVGRHGKFLMTTLEDDIIWVTHLGMSGRISLAATDDDVVAHSNVIVSLDSGEDFRFIDPRTFGFVAALTPEELQASSMGRLGRDALTDLPRAKQLHALLAGRQAPMKALLLDQSLVAGIGNIYADEALHRAGISPLRSGGSLQLDEVAALRKAIRATLQHALKYGGSSLDDLAYLLPDGRTGEYTNRLRAYGREGEHCRRCGTEMVKNIIRDRSSTWCPGCQT